MTRFIWEIIPFYKTEQKNKYLSRLSTTGKLDFDDKTDWPSTDVFKDEKGFYIISEISGIGRDNLEIYIADNKLVIVGEKPFPGLNHNRVFYEMERNYGDFKRIIEIPDSINRKSIQVEFAKGILKIKFE